MSLKRLPLLGLLSGFVIVGAAVAQVVTSPPADGGGEEISEQNREKLLDTIDDALEDDSLFEDAAALETAALNEQRINAAAEVESDVAVLQASHHGVILDSEGLLTGTFTFIDPSSLMSVPIADAEINFIQHGRIVASAKSDSSGQFVTSELTPRAVYSVIARTDDWIAARSVVVLPSNYLEQLAISKLQHENQSFVALVQNPVVVDAEPAKTLDIPAIPARDLTNLLHKLYSKSPALPVAGAAGGGGSGDNVGAILFPPFVGVDNDDVATPFTLN